MQSSFKSLKLKMHHLKWLLTRSSSCKILGWVKIKTLARALLASIPSAAWTRN